MSYGRALGAIAWHTMPARRNTAKANVQRVAKAARCGFDSADTRRIARASFDHFGRTLIEALRLPDHAPDVQWTEPDALDRIVGRRQSALILGGHLGN